MIAVLHPTKEELKTPWYINLSLPGDNQHSVLDRIVNGQLDNVSQQIADDTYEQGRDNIYVQETTIPSISRISPVVEPNSGFNTSNYVTEDRMVELLGLQKQDII